MKCTLLQEQVCYMLLEQYAFQIWSWSIFSLEYSSRLLMVQDHKVPMFQDHMVLDHKSRPKCQKNEPDYSIYNVTFPTEAATHLHLGREEQVRVNALLKDTTRGPHGV